MSLKRLLALTGLAAACGTALAAPVSMVSYGSLTGTQVVDFDDLPAASTSGTNQNVSFVSRGVAFGERFSGQSLTASGNFDFLSSTASGSLSVVAGAANRNLTLLAYNGSNVLAGLGTLGYPAFDAVGEGSFAALFSTNQSQFGFQLLGGDGGSAFVSFFRRDGSLIDTVTVGGLAESYYGFSREGGVQDIAGISIYNNDPAGIGFDNLKHDVVSSVSAVPEPETYAMLLAGLGLIGSIARRSKVKQTA